VHTSPKPSVRDWIGLCSVLRPCQHSIGYMGDGRSVRAFTNNAPAVCSQAWSTDWIQPVNA